MKSNYTEKKDARINRYIALAAQNKNYSVTSVSRAVNMIACLPMGQPILVGHHSEKKHRALIDKSNNAMRASVQAGEKAEYYNDKATSAANNNVISSDDENAIYLLSEKLEKLIKKQEFMKSVNTACKKINAAEILAKMGINEQDIKDLLTPKYTGDTKGFQSFELTNNNAKIKATKTRLEFLIKLEAISDSEIILHGVRLVGAASENRIQIFFPAKPTDKVITDLKLYGFKWAPSVGAWMRNYSNQSIRSAKSIVSKHYA